MQTLWERLVYGPPVHELTVYNPLQAKIGTLFVIDKIDFRDKPPVKLTGVVEYQRTINGVKHLFVDYMLGDVKLRVMPIQYQKNAFPFVSYLINHDSTEKWNRDLHKVLKDGGQFNIHNDGKTEEFHRIADYSVPYEHVVVKELFDQNNDGKIQENEIHSRNISYWDFWREIQDAAGQKFYEFLFIELDDSSKQFDFWRGTEIESSRIQIL